MSKWTLFTGVAGLLVLGGCDVQVRDQTPSTYPANQELGMYELKASVSRDALVTPGSVYLFALGAPKRIDMVPDKQGAEWHGIFPARCRSSIPVQFQVIWKRQGLSTGSKLVPEKPRQVTLTPPPLTKEVTVDTAAKSTKGWEGAVAYKFVTAQHTQIVGAHIEPASQDPADVAAAKQITIDSSFPVDAPCNVPTEVRMTSKAAKAQANLVIDTDLPAIPHWQTKVVFAPSTPEPPPPPKSAPRGKKK
jgi:hypothetical protein